MAKSNHETVSICVHIEGDYNFTVADLWPDGDAPAVIDAGTVRDLMEAAGSKSRVLSEWMLDDPDVDVSVSDKNPHWHGDDVMFAEHAPTEWIHTHAVVWAPKPRLKQTA